eukprot:1547981-Amphidinium_carterae.1
MDFEDKHTTTNRQKGEVLEPRGMVGRFLMCDTWWTEVHILAQEEGEFIVKKGLKPIRADTDMVQLAEPVVVSEGWSDLAVYALASLWAVIMISNGDPLWVRLAD